ncbi:hypothetical protein HA466_0205410 [Hirschfeldia incana]|nr:hypothetical protein HA466_0205410 [Hirschfeldia incana]
MDDGPMILSDLSSPALVSGLMVARAKRPVHSVLFPIPVFRNTSGLLLLLGLDFFAMIFPVVYIGAVAVSFLFVVMMFHIQIAKIHEEIMKAFHYYQLKEIRPLLDIRFMPESLILLVAMIEAIVLTMHRTTKVKRHDVFRRNAIDFRMTTDPLTIY